MSTPVLVRAYTGNQPNKKLKQPLPTKALPPVSSYTFAEILRAADCAAFRTAIDGIAEICAKNRMSLADEHASHLPPLGEITHVSSTTVRPHLLRPGMRTALTSVPEASSGSSEGSSGSSKRKQQKQKKTEGAHAPQHVPRPSKERSWALRRLRLGFTGCSISVGSVTALASQTDASADFTSGRQAQGTKQPLRRTRSEAVSSLHRLMG